MYVPKKDEHGNELPERRLVVNYKPLNACLESNQHPLPSKDYIWQRIQGCNVFSKFDLTKGFWQAKIRKEDQYKTAFSVPQGLYEWTVLPFGIKTAPSIFQGIMDKIFAPYAKFLQPYIDDILIFSQDHKSHLEHLKKFLSICQTNGICLNPSKISWCTESLIFIGTRIEPNGKIYPQKHLLETIQQVEVKDKKSLQRFLGLINYIAGYFQNIAEARKELNKRLKKNAPPWSDVHNQAIQQIKQQCHHLPHLKISRSGKKIVHTDASDTAWGAVLLEEVKQNNQIREEIVRYESGSFKGAELNYHSTHKELLAVVKAFEKFQLFIGDHKFLLRSDLKNLPGFFRKESKNKVVRARLLRWAQILDTFDFDTEHIEGSKNILADFLSLEGSVHRVHSLNHIQPGEGHRQVVLQPNLFTEQAQSQEDIIDNLDMVFNSYADNCPWTRQLYEDRRRVLIEEFTHNQQAQQQQHNVRMIKERKEEYNFIGNVPWQENLNVLTHQLYLEQRNRHFEASRQLLTDAVIQRQPCHPSDEEIKNYLQHAVSNPTSPEWPIITSVISFEWPTQILSSTHIPDQQRWLSINQLGNYFRVVFPHDHQIQPTTCNYGYLHKITFHSYIDNPINRYIFSIYGPSLQ